MSIRTLPSAPALVLLGAALAATPAPAQNPGAEIEAAEAALLSVWEKAPLAARRVAFVTERAAGYGQYTERPNAAFKPGEPLVTYMEPVGFGWKSLGPNTFTVGGTLDYAVKTKAGQVLASGEKFTTFSQTSRNRVRELFLTLTLNLSGAPPGDYVVEWTLRDEATAKTATVPQPFQIVSGP